jgi:tRNA dimethylallyltransferase
MQKTLIVICGPTGIGKTDVAISVAKHFNTEIISADSRQIFRELSIGTAVPDSQQLNTVKHHFIHSHSIHNYYNASKFEIEALELIGNIFRNHDFAVMAGGSMLYIDAVCNGIDDLPLIDQELREGLIERFENEGLENLRLELKKIDPEYYATVDLKNHKRILHALEVFYMTGKKYSSFRTNTKKERNFKIIKIALDTDRTILHKRINKRVDKMVNNGLIEEARSVFQYKKLNTLNTVGYRELFAYFENEVTREEAIELIKRNSRRYARKQLTWFRKDPDVTWFEPGNSKIIIDFINNISIDKN